MMPLLTMESITGTATFRLAAASSLLPAVTALTTALMAVRSLERAATFWARRLTVWRARFSADLILATDLGTPKKRRDSADQGPLRQAQIVVRRRGYLKTR